jgi:5-hydroxyisourate hydrolase-like protein (transthyretin family)
MRLLASLLLFAPSAIAAIDGTVTNATSGAVAAGVDIALVEPSQSGMNALATVKTDAEGKFSFPQSPKGPALLQASYQGVTYSKVLMPGAPAAGVQVQIYDVTTKPVAKVSQHMILLQPDGKNVVVSETLVMDGDPKLTYNDPVNGTVRLYLPPDEKGVQVSINAGTVPVQRPAEKTATPNVYKVSYPIKPGETRIDVSYSVPQSNPAMFIGKVLHKEGKTRLVVPNGVTLKGDNLTDIGKEPQTQASIYDLNGDSFKVEIQGMGSLQPPEADSGEDNGQPQIQQAPPHIYNKLYWIMGLVFGILGLGTYLLAIKK